LENKSKQQRYETLVNSFYKDVYRYGFWLCNNHSLAEDLVQETFMRAWRSFESLQSEKKAKAWLFTIIRRENARHYERFQPAFIDIEDYLMTESVEDSSNQVMDNEPLYRAISRLERMYREPLLLQVIGGFTGKEIGELMNLKLCTVMTRLFRARKKLVNEYFHEDDQVVS